MKKAVNGKDHANGDRSGWGNLLAAVRSLGLGIPLMCASAEGTKADVQITSVDCTVAAESEKTVSTVIRTAYDTATLTFPWSYLVPLGFKDGAERDAVVFRVHSKTFGPLGGDKVRQPLGGDGSSNMAVIVVHVIHSSKRSSVLEDFAKLQLMTHEAGESVLRPSPVTGLLQPSPPSGYRSELFMSNAPALPSDVISCHKIGSGPFPQCTHLMTVDELLVNVNYPRTQLVEWREMRRKTLQLMKCFSKGI